MKQKEDPPAVLGAQVKSKMVYHEDDRAQRLLDVFPIKKDKLILVILIPLTILWRGINMKNKLIIGSVLKVH